MTFKEWTDKFCPKKKDDPVESLLEGFRCWLYNQPRSVWESLPKRGNRVWWDLDVVFKTIYANGVERAPELVWASDEARA